MAHMNSSATTMRKPTLVLVIVGLAVLSAARLAGQGPFAPATGPLDLILQKLAAIEEAVAPPEPSEVTLRTSAAPIHQATFVDCRATNVSTRTIQVSITRRIADGTADDSISQAPLSPGGSTGFGNFVDTGLSRRCEFTFTGFAGEMRGNMTTADPTLGNILPMAVFEAR